MTTNLETVGVVKNTKGVVIVFVVLVKSTGGDVGFLLCSVLMLLLLLKFVLNVSSKSFLVVVVGVGVVKIIGVMLVAFPYHL